MTTYRDVNEALPALARRIIQDGERVGARLGQQTQEVIMANFTLTEPLNREVVVPGRKASLPAQIVETAWVLSGKDDIETLLPYLPRAAEFSDDGQTWRAAYGPRLRNWGAQYDSDGGCDDHIHTDQLAEVVRLLNDERGTRRAVMSIFDPAQDYTDSKDIPCNNWISFISRNGVLHAQVAIRSNDLIWGWSGINQFEWSVLLEIVAKLTGNKVGTITYSTTSLHIYERHFSKAEQLADLAPREYASDPVPRFAPNMPSSGNLLHELDALLDAFWYCEGRIRTGKNVQAYWEFPEPMLRSWLQVLAFHWTREGSHLRGLELTPLWLAAHESPKPPKKETPPATRVGFPEFAANLHAEKSAVYGDSWKKRGEAMSIIPNEARKVDRLGVAGAGDSAADTVIDLLIYLIKHRLWLDEGHDLSYEGSENDAVALQLRQLEMQNGDCTSEMQSATGYIVSMFEELVSAVDRGDTSRYSLIDRMLPTVYVLARSLWESEQDGYSGADAD